MYDAKSRREFIEFVGREQTSAAEIVLLLGLAGQQNIAIEFVILHENRLGITFLVL
jgi:hypothetical protein